MLPIRYIVCLSSFLAVLIISARGKTCNSHSECDLDECCVTKNAFLGGCRTRPCKGCSCVPEIPTASVGDMFFMSCPCLTGLVCVPEAVVRKDEEMTVEYLNSTCKTQEDLLILYKRLLETRGENPQHLNYLHKLLTQDN